MTKLICVTVVIGAVVACSSPASEQTGGQGGASNQTPTGAAGDEGSANGGTRSVAGSGGQTETSSAGIGGTEQQGGLGGTTPPAGGKGGVAAGGAASGGMATGGTSMGGTSTGGSWGGQAGFGIAEASRCASSGLAFCENFETGLDAAIWTTTRQGDGTAVVDSVHAARGTKALHLKTTGSGRAFIRERKSFPVTNNILYARMYVWFEDPLTTNGHFSLAEATGSGTSAMIRFGGQFKSFGVGTDGGPSGDWTDRDSKVIPTKTWLCMEFQLDGPGNEFRVWRDDTELVALRTGSKRHPNFTMPQFNSLWFGWWMYNDSEPQDIWIDEIAVDSKPIGCAK